MCPECEGDHLFFARARQITLTVRRSHDASVNELRPTDMIFCEACGWCRFATADDMPAMERLMGRSV